MTGIYVNTDIANELATKLNKISQRRTWTWCGEEEGDGHEIIAVQHGDEYRDETVLTTFCNKKQPIGERDMLLVTEDVAGNIGLALKLVENDFATDYIFDSCQQETYVRTLKQWTDKYASQYPVYNGETGLSDENTALVNFARSIDFCPVLNAISAKLGCSTRLVFPQLEVVVRNTSVIIRISTDNRY